MVEWALYIYVIERAEYLYCILTKPTDRIIFYYKLLMCIIIQYIGIDVHENQTRISGRDTTNIAIRPPPRPDFFFFPYSGAGGGCCWR